jgi:DNA-binding beta-propeller fold protein YncE
MKSNLIPLTLAFLLAGSTTVAAQEIAPKSTTTTTTMNTTSAASAAEGTSPPLVHTLDHEGVKIEVRVEPLDGATSLVEGGHVRVAVAIEDGHTGRPLPGLFPAAWMDLLPPGGDVEVDSCKQKVEGFLGGSLLSRAELDLNVFYVLTMNEEPTITVVDPLFGFGGSKLLARVRLGAPGYDWALTESQDRLFVSVPDLDSVAMIDTGSWELLTRVDVEGTPRRVALQPDGAFLWVSHDAGVSMVGTTALKELARIPTGAGPHDVAFSADGRFAFVANAGAGTVSVVDVAERRKLRDLEVGGRPVSLSFSATASSLYVGDQRGQVVAIDGEGKGVVARVAVEPGVSQVRVTPDGRWALAVNPEEDSLYVVDTAANRMVQNGQMEPGPVEIAFTDELAYVTHRDSDLVLTLPLAALGAEGQPLQVIDFPGGTAPAGLRPDTSAAPAMAQAPGAPAMLIANHGDSSIYFYKEGMAAPMGQFKNYGRAPRAVLVVDRSLDEKRPGVYETAARLARPGAYELALFLDSPRVVHCIPLEVAADPSAEAKRRPKLAIAPLEVPAEVAVGQPVDLAFRLTDPRSGQPITGLSDVAVLTVLSPGTWHDRALTEELGEGVYRLRFTPPREGVYYVYLASPSHGVAFNHSPQRAFRAVAEVAETVSGDAVGAVSETAPAGSGGR